MTTKTMRTRRSTASVKRCLTERWLRVIAQIVHINGFISHASASSHHCRRCGTALTAFRRARLVVWIVLGQSARRNAKGREDTMKTCIVIITTQTLSLLLLPVSLLLLKR